MPRHHLQHTLATAIQLEGVGVHAGTPARLVLKPAADNHGIVFVRTDISEKDNRIPARYDLVSDTRLCTVLQNAAGARVATVEHLMSALAALGIDNAEIEINGPEVPIMDGSALPFVAAIDRAGKKTQSAPRRVLRVLKPIVYSQDGKTASLRPADTTSYAFDIEFDSAVIGHQHFNHTAEESAYRRDIAFARTFGFLAEVEALRAAGLGRGGSLDNAIVIDGDRVLNPGGLRHPAEFVRHKILDAIGDLALAGARLQAAYHGNKAGHALNNQALRALFADPSAYAIVPMAPAAAGAGATTRAGTRREETALENGGLFLPA